MQGIYKHWLTINQLNDPISATSAERSKAKYAKE